MGRSGDAGDLYCAGWLLAHRTYIDLGVIDDRIHLLCGVSNDQAFRCEGKITSTPYDERRPKGLLSGGQPTAHGRCIDA